MSIFWILLPTALAAFIYFKLIKPFTYWSQQGVPQLDVWTIWKRLFQVFSQLRRPADSFRELYNSFDNYRYAGMYQFFRPSILLRDPDLIKLITVKDFDHFVDRSQLGVQDTEPLWQKNLVSLKGDQWRDMRSTLSPSFTSSKMKAMFGLICQCAEQTVGYFEDQASPTAQVVEAKDAFNRYTSDVIASVAFGVQCDSLRERENEFYKMGKKATNFASPRFILLVIAPRLARLLGIKLFSDEVSSFFRRLVKDNMAQREEEGIVRPDMIHLLMEAKKGRLKHEKQSEKALDGGFAVIEESDVGKQENRHKKSLTDDDITAQAFMFFLAGFDTVSSEMAFMAYELALNPDIQNRLQSEIDKTFTNHGGSLTYDALVKMKYLDMVISETLRKWPASAVMDRVCVKPYTIQPVKTGEKPAYLKKGDHLLLPIFGIHRDPHLYPNPDRFDPERFSDENKSKIRPYSFLAFGAGPRGCIGNRFALLEIKVVFCYLLSKFDVEVVDQTVVPLRLGSNPVTLSSEGGVWLGLKRRGTK